MRTASRVMGMVVGITGLFQIVLGLLFWTGVAQFLIPLHMVVGIVFVLALWTTAGLAIKARAPIGPIALAFAWGAVVILLGVAQAQILPGPNHWIIRVLHLAVGLAAMAQAGGLARRIRDGAAGEPVPATEPRRAT
jgi:hypothetical protein